MLVSTSLALRDNRSSLAEFCEASMTDLLFKCGNVLAAYVWICFIGPWLARLCGIPVPTEFWKKDWQKMHFSRLRFVWAFGVLIFGFGMFLFNLDHDVVNRVLLDRRWSAKLSDVAFALAFSIFMTSVIAFWCAPTLSDKSPVTELGLSRRQ
jgi:hypothetical protein